MKTLNNTLTTILFNENGFIRPYFNYRSNIDDIIEWGKETLKSEWDLEWENDKQLEGIINSMMGQISNKKELTYEDEALLEFGSIQTHLFCEERDNELKEVSCWFMEDRGDDYGNVRTITALNPKSDVYKQLKKVYKNEDTILELELQKKVIQMVSKELIDYFMNELIQNAENEDMDIRDKLSYNKLIIVHAATLLNMEEDKDDKKLLETFVDRMISAKNDLEEIIIDEKVNDLFN